MQTRPADDPDPTPATVPTVNLDWNGRREPAWYEGVQRILNAHDVPERFTQARAPIPVRARLEWENDGIELVDTVATAWTHSLALVTVDGARSRFRGVWIDIGEVVRR
ncbi:hypothetical protein ATJ97_0061 [Georgenia soli]|uniref:Uncharacterized protein n=1 Tax=Georgenia soli TaxID=638953 RepID=A0A2A9F3Z9_9MICO|nr:hypothetical protein [Georgenia soli]PFG45139.1 hypothetical protein ATJ97_0061 [Georgenia soli]